MCRVVAQPAGLRAGRRPSCRLTHTCELPVRLQWQAARPGQPLPEPRSAKAVRTAIRGSSCRLSRTCLFHRSSTDAGEIRLMRCCQCKSKSTKASMRVHDSRETLSGEAACRASSRVMTVLRWWCIRLSVARVCGLKIGRKPKPPGSYLQRGWPDQVWPAGPGKVSAAIPSRVLDMPVVVQRGRVWPRWSSSRNRSISRFWRSAYPA